VPFGRASDPDCKLRGEKNKSFDSAAEDAARLKTKKEKFWKSHNERLGWLKWGDIKQDRAQYP